MIGFLPQLGLAAVLLVGGTSVIHSHLTLGQFTAFYFYLAMLISPMRSLGVTLGLAQRATASGARIFQLLDREPRLSSPPGAPALPAGSGHVQLRGVTLKYDDTDDFGAAYRSQDDGRRDAEAGGDQATGVRNVPARASGNGAVASNGSRPTNPDGPGTDAGPRSAPSPRAAGARAVLNHVDLDVPAGRTVALVGATGSGKTSLVSLISRLYDPSSGTVMIDGADVRDVELRSLRRAVAVVSDDPFLFSASVAENIAYARPDASREDIERAARRAQAHEFIAELPDGYDTRVGERGLMLSGGQRQRLAIARALLADPRVLILDDATSSVDSSTERLIKLALDEAMTGRTTFIIAHRLSTIALADEIVVVDHGRVLAHGDHAQLLERSELYREIVAKGLPDQIFLTTETREREVSSL
jgi:ABC-type multidrug transport system fused ATPase/permease subunit